MKKLVHSLVTVFITFCMVSQSFAGIDASEVKISFSNSSAINQSIVVRKLIDSRDFYLCETVNGTINRDSCKLVQHFSVQKFQKQDLQLHKHIAKYISGGIGLVAGFVVGGLIGIMTGDSPENGDTNNKAFFVVWAAITGFGFLVGTAIDSDHLTALQIADIRGTIGRPDILDENTKGSISIDVNVQDFINMIQDSGKVLQK